MSNNRNAPLPRYRFDRRGNVVRELRRPGPTVGTDDYRTGDPLFAARHGSPARRDFHARTK